MGKALAAVKPKTLLKLDLGCGSKKEAGFHGVDRLSFPGVDTVFDLASPKRWPFEDESIEEARCIHFLEHLTSPERVHFANELYRVLVPGGKTQVVTPYWASNRAYGDPTHQWPPVSEMFSYYLKRDWRKENAPHTEEQWDQNGFRFDFDVTWGYVPHPLIAARNAELQQMLFSFAKEAAQDMVSTWTKPLKA